MWYDLYVKCVGDHVEVWRAELGEDMTKILETDNATMLTSDHLVFKQGLGTCLLDDVLVPNNWDTFLHLKGGAGQWSPCVDTGNPWDSEDAKRDFDDHVSPLDIQGQGYDLPQSEEDPDHKPYDMGADEYSTLSPDGFSFWWENFRIVLSQ